MARESAQEFEHWLAEGRPAQHAAQAGPNVCEQAPRARMVVRDVAVLAADSGTAMSARRRGSTSP